MQPANQRTSLISDDVVDGPGTVLVLKGFSGEKEIYGFVEALTRVGLLSLKPPLRIVK